MNNENNNLNTEPVVVNNNPVPTTQPVNDKFMTVSDINQINQPAVQPPVVPSQPVVQQPVLVEQRPDIGPTSAGPQPTAQPDNNAMINENLKKVEIKDYTPPSKFKVALLIIFFIVLIAFVIFLPDISSMISLYTSGGNNNVATKITTGKLVCTLETNTTELDKDYEYTFTFSDSKLKKIKYASSIRGDSTTETNLDEMNEKCNTFKKNTNDIEGFYVRCDYSNGELIETQNLDLATVESEKLDSAYTEAGGMAPTYTLDQNIDEIESNMKVSGYSCTREK